MSTVLDAVVVGAGISGLTCGYALQKSGADIQLLERRDSAGGSIRTLRDGAYLLELGPNTIQRSTPEVEQLVTELGLDVGVVLASEKAGKRYIVRSGEPRAVPSSPLDLFTTKLLSWKARLNILGEPFRVPASNQEDESVADFVRRRLGAEFLDYIIDPFVSGVYAGDPARLSVRHAFPKVKRLEDESGSLIRGSIKAMRRRARALQPRWKMFSFSDGLQALPEAIAHALGARLALDSSVVAIQEHADHWTVQTESSAFNARSIVLTVPLHALGMIDFRPPVTLDEIPRVSYPPLMVVHSAYRRTDVDHSLDGFGMLVSSQENDVAILGALFSSSLFPDRAPPAQALLTSFIGGRRNEGIINKPDDVIFEEVDRDLSRLLGIRSGPVFQRIHRWQNAIPQYEIGYDAVLSEIRRIEGAHPGLHFAGNYRNGISVTETITSALRTADRLLIGRA